MTDMGLNNPDEGLVGGQSVRNEARAKKRRRPFESGGTDEALKVRLERRKMMLNIDRMTWWPNWVDLGMHFRRSGI